MNYRKRFVVEPGTKVRLGKIAPAFKDKHQSHDTAKAAIEKHVERSAKAQYLLYADGSRSFLVASCRHSMPAARTASCATFLPP